MTGKCSTSGGSLAFGSYDPIAGAAVSVAGSISVKCTRGTPNVTISLDNGSNAAHASLAMTRAMNSGSNYISYDIYQDLAHATVWNAVNTVSYASTSMAAVSLPLYGYIPGGQDVPVSASYGDSVTATVNF